MARSFKGVVGGVTYTDPSLFEQAARALGFRPNKARQPKWKVGTPVGIRLESGERIEGQVWALDWTPNYAWIALDDGRYARVNMHYGNAQITNGQGVIVADGRVAA